jgi:quercetin dioxygenase-like cupin family protein
MSPKLLPSLACFAVLAACAAQQSTTHSPEHARISVPGNIKWSSAPASLRPGAWVAILEGDPTQPGMFTMRLKMPDGYRIMPHQHPKRERITVVSGTFQVGMGDTWDDAKLGDLPTGTYAYVEPGNNHFAQAQGETVIQLNGEGPWSLKYVNPADDPRQKNK